MSTTVPLGTTSIPAPVPVPGLRTLRGLLVVTAAIEAWGGFGDVGTLFGDMSQIPGRGITGGLIEAYLFSHPLLAVAALVLFAKGRLREGILALSASMLMSWLSIMPSVVLQGAGPGSAVGAVMTLPQMLGLPLMAACAVALVLRDQRPWLAGTLVMLPTLISALGIMAFAISVTLFGF